MHTHLIGSVLNDVLRVVTGCLRLTPIDKLPVLSGIQPAWLRREKATLSLANRSSLNPDHILHGQLTESQAASKKRLKSRHPFVPAVRKLLRKIFEFDIRVAQWTNLTWDMEHSKSTSVLGVYIPKISAKLIEMSLTGTPCVKLKSPAYWGWALRFVQMGSRFFS